MNGIKICAHLLNGGTKKEANDCIVEMLECAINNGTQYPEMWASIAESAGFYPYLEKYKELLYNEDITSAVTKEFFSSHNMSGIYFHREQKAIVDRLYNKKNMIVSAPTSFGKSLLIEEIVASCIYRNILVIQPTLALLDETRKKLSKYCEKYKIVVHTSQQPDMNKGNIYLFTAERVLEYKDFVNIDFLVLDEFYKLSKKRDDERADLLNNAFHNVVRKYQCKFMLLGPNIDNISEGFDEKYDADFFKTDYSLVLNKEINIYQQYEGQFGSRGNKRVFKERVLFELLNKLEGEPTLIFCSSPERVRKLGKAYVEYLITKQVKKARGNISLIEWIERNVSENWSLKKMLEYGVGIHDGSLPKHITSSIINYFTEGDIKHLFCTTTIIEGVNTCAKNIVYFDKVKGRNVPIDYFDYCNIRGRAGRLMIHFTGNIYNFNEPPKPEQTIVDIPFYEQENVSDEIIINLEYDEMRYPDNEQNQYILNIPDDIKAIFRQNGVSVRGQENILVKLKDIKNYDMIKWTGMPSYEQLRFALSLAWENLLKEGETTRPMTLNKLIKLTFDYGNGKTIKDMMKSDYEYRVKDKVLSIEEKREVLDETIQSIFQIVRHWFQYKVPKWIGVVNRLQQYACDENGVKAGDYTYYASRIENDTIAENVALLLEYNIPSSTIKKISHLIPNDIYDQQLVDYIFERKLHQSSELIDYEKELMSRNLISSQNPRYR